MKIRKISIGRASVKTKDTVLSVITSFVGLIVKTEIFKTFKMIKKTLKQIKTKE